MITIKEFAKLINCNTQTLRYYDRIDLLKPVKVDKFSSYRYYEKKQAIDFIKIKNLQAADFSIEEIKSLLKKSDKEIYDAFENKIAAEKGKLQKIIEIRDTYLSEKTSMEKIVQSIRELLVNSIKDYEMLKEFGLDPKEGEKIKSFVSDYFDKAIGQAVKNENICLVIDDKVIEDKEEIAETLCELNGKELPSSMNFTDSPENNEEDSFDENDFDVIFETAGFERVYEFYDKLPLFESNIDYIMCFKMRDKLETGDTSFPLLALGSLLYKNPEYTEKNLSVSCNVESGKTDVNSFKLLRAKKKEDKNDIIKIAHN